MREEKEKKIDERCDNQEDLEGWVVGWRTGTNYVPGTISTPTRVQQYTVGTSVVRRGICCTRIYIHRESLRRAQ